MHSNGFLFRAYIALGEDKMKEKTNKTKIR
jgi:hypothetical protein